MGIPVFLVDGGKARDAKPVSKIFKCIILGDDDAEPPLGVFEEFGLNKVD